MTNHRVVVAGWREEIAAIRRDIAAGRLVEAECRAILLDAAIDRYADAELTGSRR